MEHSETWDFLQEKQFHHTLYIEWKEFCFIAKDHVTHITLQVQSASAIAVFLHATAFRLAQHADYGHAS
jgi:hypothetical protein